MIMGMKILRNLLIPLGTLAVALVIVGGAAYAYQRSAQVNHQNDSLLTSAQDRLRQRTADEQHQAAVARVQASLQSATARLAQLRAALSPVRAIADAYDTFKKEGAALTALASRVKGSKAAELASANQALADTLQAWKILLSTIPPSGPSDAQIAQAERYASEAQNYVNQIQTIADSLSPSNSGLTQNEIGQIQTIADTASDEANKTSNDLATALPIDNGPSDTDNGNSGHIADSGSPTAPTSNSSGADGTSSTDPSAPGTTPGSGTSSGSSAGGVTAADVAQQQQVVDQLQDQVDQLQHQDPSTGGGQDSGGSATAPPGTEGDVPPPQLQFDTHGRPKLIQGSNKL